MNTRQIKILFTFLIILFADCLPAVAGNIRHKISRDGTIEYYNSTIKPGKKAGIKFNSYYDSIIEKISRKKSLDPYLIKCIIKVESDFKSDAISPAGAMGLMQIMQEIADLYNVKDAFDPDENLRAGISHFKTLMRYFKGDIELALAAYHAGIGRVKRNMAIPPIKSTINYVNRVMYYYRGKKSISTRKKVNKLYKRINKEGVINIYN